MSENNGSMQRLSEMNFTYWVTGIIEFLSLSGMKEDTTMSSVHSSRSTNMRGSRSSANM